MEFATSLITALICAIATWLIVMRQHRSLTDESSARRSSLYQVPQFRLRFGMRGLFAAVAIASVVAVLSAPALRYYLKAREEHIDEAPYIGVTMEIAEVNSQSPEVIQLWLLMGSGKLLGSKASDFQDLLDMAPVILKRNRQVYYEFPITRKTGSEGEPVSMGIFVGRNGLVLRCGINGNNVLN